MRVGEGGRGEESTTGRRKEGGRRGGKRGGRRKGREEARKGALE